MSTFTPRSSHISNATFTCSLLLADSLAAGRRSAPRYRYSGHYTAIVTVRRFVIKSLFTCKWVGSGQEGRRGSVRVRARASARVTVRDRDRI